MSDLRRWMRLIEMVHSTTPPKPDKQHLLDAIHHADWAENGWTLNDFNLRYEGYLTVDEIKQFDDVTSWLEVDEPDDLENYRDGSFSRKAREMPPIVLITAPDEGHLVTQIGDGRGRVNFANAHGLRLHVWHLIMKKNTKLGESDDMEDEDSEFDDLLPSSSIRRHLKEICAAAQKVYDSWDQSDPDNDELNGGGICHLIADEIAYILGSAGLVITTVSWDSEVHVSCVAQCMDGIFEIDIPYRIYENGGGYTWHKIPNVIFKESDVFIHKISSDPGDFRNYENE